MLSCFDVADYFIWFSNKNNVKVYTMTIHKNVYYAQAWYLAIYDQPLFEEDFQAWIYGPVIPELYAEYKICDSRKPISINLTLPRLSPEIENFLQIIATSFIDINRFTLSDLTHEKGSPWDLTRGNLPPDARSQKIIPKNLIKNYYKRTLIDNEQNNDSEMMGKFLDFLINDTENNPKKLVTYTEKMLQQDKQLLNSIFS